MSIRRPWESTALIALALVIAGCGPSATVEHRVTGRRVNATSVASAGDVPYRVGSYELVFANDPTAGTHARRAALLVDLAGGQGNVRGFVEFGALGGAPLTYVAGGWARERRDDGMPVTVFELSLDHLATRNGHRRSADTALPTPLAVRLVVDETSGDVTLIRRR